LAWEKGWIRELSERAVTERVWTIERVQPRQKVASWAKMKGLAVCLQLLEEKVCGLFWGGQKHQAMRVMRFLKGQNRHPNSDLGKIDQEEQATLNCEAKANIG